MTYAGSEVSVHGGTPNELYKFEGTYSTYLYTSGPVAIIYDDGSGAGDETYLPIAIQRGAINAGTQDDDQLDLTITISVKHQVVLDYAFEDTPPSLQLSIYRYHGLDDVRPFWFGPVNNIQVTNGRAQIRSYSKLGAALGQDFPNVYYQSPCNHTVFDAHCKMVYADHSSVVATTLINGRTLTFAAVPDLVAGKLLGGEVKLASGERRMVTAETATTVTVNFAFSSNALTLGDEVTLAKGCDLAYLGDCKTSFMNQINFGGYPFIPSDNPFTTGIDPNTVLDDGTCPPPAFTGLVTIYHYYQDIPCNPDYGATRQLYFPETQPNAHGRVLSTFNPMPANGVSYIYEFDDYINPASAHFGDPDYSGLHGQKLVKFEMANLEWVVTFYFYVAVGDWTQTIEYPAFFCHSVDLDLGNQKISVCRATSQGLCAAEVVVDIPVGGNIPYSLEFHF